MRWLVAGAKGMLGQDLVARITAEGLDVDAVDIETLDITDPANVKATVTGYDIVANVAAFTAVDRAEEQENAAFAVNATGPEILARRCKEINARFLHISTDYVFAGDATEPYSEDALIAPRSAYGRTKAAGEWAIRANTDNYIIVRTAWLYGAHGRCFPKAIVNNAKQNESFTVVADEVGQPTWTVDLADLIVRLVVADAPSGTYHGTSQGSTNWADFARAILTEAGMNPSAIANTTAAILNRAAPRPHFSCLAHDALRAIGIEPIGDWSERWKAASAIVLA